MAKHRYLVALGSNLRHPRHGAPRRVLAAALRALDRRHVKVRAVSPIVESAPLGPSRRRYANAVALVKTHREPADLLERLQHIERKFGRRRHGQPWQARVLDLDIALWDGGPFVASDLVIPHPEFRERAFVLQPAARIAGRWRDPITGLSVTHLAARLTKPRPAPR